MRQGRRSSFIQAPRANRPEFSARSDRLPNARGGAVEFVFQFLARKVETLRHNVFHSHTALPCDQTQQLFDFKWRGALCVSKIEFNAAFLVLLA